MEGKVCTTCGDIVHHLAWRQMDLFGTHVLRFTACECQCGYKLIAVTVGEVVTANG